MQINLQDRRFRTILIIAVLLVALLALFVLSKVRQDTGQYEDPLSQQTISDPPGKTPDTYGTNKDNPVYLGFDKLLDYGLTLDQLNNLKAAFYLYSRQQSSPLKEVSMDISSLNTGYTTIANHDRLYYVTYKVKLDRTKDFIAKVEYSGLSAVRLYLLNQGDQSVVYDSQIVDESRIIDPESEE